VQPVRPQGNGGEGRQLTRWRDLERDRRGSHVFGQAVAEGSVVSMEPAQGALRRRVKVAYPSNRACIFTSLPIDHLALFLQLTIDCSLAMAEGASKTLYAITRSTAMHVFFASLEADSIICKLRDDGKEHSIAVAVISCLLP
jgi:hypothetical protein